MQTLTPYVVAFAAGVGALLGGLHGAILATTIILGVIVVTSMIGAASLAKQQQAQAQALAEQIDKAAASGEWGGVPPTDEELQQFLGQDKTDDA